VPSKDKVKEQIIKENQGQPSSNYLSKLRARKQHLAALLSIKVEPASKKRKTLEAWHAILTDLEREAEEESRVSGAQGSDNQGRQPQEEEKG
jgi:hypothetical protein